MGGVLDGIRVVELNVTQAGAPVGQLLADNGADVIMVEPPDGSKLRAQPAFAFWARGKRSLPLDLRAPDGIQRLHELLREADVLVDTLRPDALPALGLSTDEVTIRYPRLVHTSITGFGSTGPLRNLKGYEGIVMAKIGGLTPFEPLVAREGPAFVSVPYCTFGASQLALQGTLTALYERERSGRGQHVEVSLAQAFAALDPWNWYVEAISARYPDAFTAGVAYDDDLVPSSGLLSRLATLITKDGVWLQFAQGAPHLFDAFLRHLGLDKLDADPIWKGAPDFDDPEKRRAFGELLIEKARERTYDQWVEIFKSDRNVFAERYRSGSEYLDHPQVIHDGLTVELADPEHGVVRQLAPMVRIAENPGEIRSGAPTLGEKGGDSFCAAVQLARPTSAPDLPLAGLTVLEMATVFAAPYSASLLSDLGARVIKLEPIQGDLIRHMLPFPDLGSLKAMQGKESIAVDLKTSDGARIVRDIAARADIVVQGYRAGVGERLGVDVKTLRTGNTELIYLNAPAYGTDGPYADKPAFAPSMGAATGLSRRNMGSSLPSDPSLPSADLRRAGITLFIAGTPAAANADGLSALGCSVALVLGLLGRSRGKGPATITTSMLATTAHALGDVMVDYAGMPPLPVADPELFGLSALYRLYRSADGWVFLAAPDREDWAALSTAVSLAADPLFCDVESRQAHDDQLAAALAHAFSSRTSVEWEERLTSVDVACVEVTGLSPEATLLGAFGRDHGFVSEAEHPLHGMLPRLAPLIRFSRSATTVGPPCTLGDRTDAILAEVGRTPEQIADLRARGIVA
jgi:crotonobetainyl-CoA:carnitine CoA-transferase CaiB-like acyl-CoA transferase